MSDIQDRIIKKAELQQLVARIQADYAVLAPARDIGTPSKVVWKRLEDAEQLNFAFVNTDMSPKEFFFPQSECMMTFSSGGETPGQLTPTPQNEAAFALMNVRPCDAKAMSVMDGIFLQDDKSNDVYWRQKRERSLLVGLACNHPCPTCFCKDVHCGPHHTEGLDLLLVDVGDEFLVKVVTEQGAKVASALPEAPDDASAQASELQQAAEENMGEHIAMDRIEGRDVNTLYEMPFWERISETCLNCGTCTFVCPTCHCFDIQDETAAHQGEEGRRVRNWDTCMAPLFTLHASGHNPRDVKTARVRQRFMHKFKYIPMKRNGDIGCVGCGRCARLCPVNIDVCDAVNAMNAQE